MNTMLDYINQQQRVLEDILINKNTNLNNFTSIVKKTKTKRWLVLATGSSYNSVLCAKMYIEKVSKVSIEIKEPYNFYEYENISEDIDLIIAVSQRGTSTSTIDAVERVNKVSKVPLVILTSIMDSPITKLNDNIVDIGCGVETVGYSTKGVTATILTLMIMGIETARSKDLLFENQIGDEYTKLTKMVSKIPSIIKKTIQFYHNNKARLDASERISPLGYGPNVGTVREAETKFTETVRVPSQGLEIEAYMHGPIFELHKNSTLFFTEVVNAKPYERSRKLEMFVSRHCDNIFTITTNKKTGSKHELSLEIVVDELLSPLLLVIPYQLFSFLISKAKGIDLSIPVYTNFKEVMQSKVE
ncbi:glucoselysine-6-phosphate deglycase [Virgibacillus halotolerans]|uniref:SIS domain-containing protein n=1 Tax=Virgibacillus halotolerans TaxID=1071053 RepID=UPI0019601921|nr:SIS domain-containing protein [Virgibacillus halotolerans]MBM7599017.1 glucoselysine-6-phosphate deglycase [Virgibacillus halotolerans]